MLLTVGDLIQTFPNPTPAPNDEFGPVAAIGDNIAVGAPFDDTAAQDAGAVYLFDRAGNLLRTILSPTSNATTGFGSAVAAVDDKLLIGARFADVTSVNGGAAYLFDQNGNLLTTFHNPSPNSGDLFGTAVAAVGSNVVVSANFDDAGAGDSGAAYLFDQQGNLLATYLNPTPAANDQFGFSVAGLGNHVLISAPLDDTGAFNSGSVYLFDSTGALLQTIVNPIPGSNDSFGSSIAAVGNNILVGAPLDDTDAFRGGSAYLFDNSGNLLTTISNPSPGVNDNFGVSVAAVGEHVLIAAHNDNGGVGTGYLFDSSGNLIATIANPTPAPHDFFGWRVAAAGTDILFSAVLDDTAGPDSGTVYLFAGVNAEPTANDDAFSIAEDSQLVVAAPGVLANDTDPDLDTLAVTQVISGPYHGTLILAADGSFTYTPHADFSGTDTFRYEASDGKGGLDSALVSITVLSPQQQIQLLMGDVQELVDQGALTAHQGRFLRQNLRQAERHLDHGRIMPALVHLRVFTIKVRLFVRLGILSQLEADPLLDLADQAIKSTLPG